MRRSSLRPRIECLEGRSMLSAIAPAMPSIGTTGVSVTLTTDHSVYTEGQPVHMTLTEKNTTNHDVTIAFGPSIDGFFVTKHRTTVWRSNIGPQPQYIAIKVLHPGQSFTLSETWDGKSDIGRPRTPTGILLVHSEVAGANTVAIRIRR